MRTVLSVLLFLLTFFLNFTLSLTPQIPIEPAIKNKTFKLKHVIHKGRTLYPNLVRRKDFDEAALRVQEESTGVSFTHSLRAVSGIVTKPVSREDRSVTVKTVGLLPDVRDKDTLVSLGKMTYNAYLEIGGEGWYDLGDRYDLVSDYLYYTSILCY